MKVLFDVLGWAGSLLIVTAYFLNSSHRISSKHLMYQLMNIAGSALLIVNTVYYRTYPVATLNVVWLVIGITSLYRISKSAS